MSNDYVNDTINQDIIDDLLEQEENSISYLFEEEKVYDQASEWWDDDGAEDPIVCSKKHGFLTKLFGQLFNISIFKENPGVISENACWICSHGYYIYTADTFVGLIRMLLTEWKNNKHYVGQDIG